MVKPACGFAYCDALRTSSPHTLCKYLVQMVLLDCRFKFQSSGYAQAASSKFCLALFSPQAACVLSVMSAFRHLFDLALILTFSAMVLRLLVIAS